jgi:hypothetical protein
MVLCRRVYEFLQHSLFTLTKGPLIRNLVFVSLNATVSAHVTTLCRVLKMLKESPAVYYIGAISYSFTGTEVNYITP